MLHSFFGLENVKKYSLSHITKLLLFSSKKQADELKASMAFDARIHGAITHDKYVEILTEDTAVTPIDKSEIISKANSFALKLSGKE